MKIFFDTNVYVAEALLGAAAERLLAETADRGWRIFTSAYVLDELARVLSDELGASRRFAALTRRRTLGRARLVEPRPSRHAVPQDPTDSPILRAALAAGADYLVTNDPHLLSLNPYEGLRIISMHDYLRLIESEQSR